MLFQVLCQLHPSFVCPVFSSVPIMSMTFIDSHTTVVVSLAFCTHLRFYVDMFLLLYPRSFSLFLCSPE